MTCQSAPGLEFSFKDTIDSNNPKEIRIIIFKQMMFLSHMPLVPFSLAFLSLGKDTRAP
ncbi:unnamed protein product [Staurois parvus]|uniref:Uncharacterized protein n=1 Tax=Staurois parvus TaxID=386267 RepID=A0ABN9BR26_9NEOB|nr:unnamed protein product [Staurois parvus]